MKIKQTESPQLLFWPGSLNGRGFTELLEAASSGGYGHMAVSPLMVDQLLSSGRSAADLLAEADSHHVQFSHLDGVSSWAPLWYQADPFPWIKERFDFSSEKCLDMAEALGMTSILAAGAFDKGALSLDELIQAFGEFCDAAAKRNLRVELEFVPFWGIPDLTFAWKIVQGANRPNGGILVDTWHLHKGTTNLEADLELLASIPSGIIQNVQVADARLAKQADTLYGEGRFRLFPGSGELAIDRILRIIAATGELKWIGTEIFGDAIDQLTSAEAGKQSSASLRSIISGLDQ
ncbi:sugar phosphate isomerase/epimerase [Paenibacillus sp. VMFN-D1]|uniref:sugar phosphate isomerase/epimerase family protein n=1 Tax=Paenibacillus sp. VMFN-D1 TaxID=2135608 RepID=UPI000E269DBA|nr:sugar phosphate isomerase/epimerase [Paenibacillus sp. VMFN-D1]RED37391.1 sugar phosphate isomerase/epimerase [Paenibacillus sp. VMFN-D1]